MQKKDMAKYMDPCLIGHNVCSYQYDIAEKDMPKYIDPVL